MNKAFYDTFKAITSEIDKLFTMRENYAAVFGDQMAAEKIKEMNNLKKKAIEGDGNARNIVIDTYTRFLASNKLPEMVKKKVEDLLSIINFNEPLKNSSAIKFDMLLMVKLLINIIDDYNWLSIYEVNEKELDEVVRDSSNSIKDFFNEESNKFYFLGVLIYSREFGSFCCDTLSYQNKLVNELSINTKDKIYVYWKSKNIWLKFLSFGDFDIYEKMITNKARGQSLSPGNPIINFSDLRGNRITIVGKELMSDKESISYNQRFFDPDRLTVHDLVSDDYKTLNDLCCRIIEMNIKAKKTTALTGADMGVGKSTALGAFVEYIPNNSSIGVLDRQNELQLISRYVNDIKEFIGNTDELYNQLVDISFKTMRDYIIVGEQIYPNEINAMIRYSLKLKAGVLFTVHMASPTYCIRNLRNDLNKHPAYNDARRAEDDVANSLDLIVHFERHRKDRKRIILKSITEVVYTEGDDYIRDSNQQQDMKTKWSKVLDLGQVILKQKLMGRNYRYNPIIKYNYKKEDWELINMPSKQYIEELEERISEEDIRSYVDTLEKYASR